jgi:hypothetical protein
MQSVDVCTRKSHRILRLQALGDTARVFSIG